MESGLVLVIEGDEHTSTQLAAAIREADYEVVVSPTATAGLDIAIEIKPDCVVCDIDLPDQDGFWVARNIRTHPSSVSVTPFLFLSAHDDPQSRIQGFHVGADVYMTKPFRAEEVVAQVNALVHMAARLRERRDSLLSLTPEAGYGTTAIEGDLRQMSIATVLSVLGMERRTGVFEVVSKKRHAQIEIAGGYVVQGTIGGTRVGALGAMRVMLGWTVGRFSFTPLPPCDPPPSLRTVQVLLLDAAKAEDEAAASSSLQQFDGRIAGSSFGGPPSRPHDTGPPSSRAMREAPTSLTFDLLPSLRPENLPAAEVSAAIDAPLAALERVRAHVSSLAEATLRMESPPGIDEDVISVSLESVSLESVSIESVSIESVSIDSIEVELDSLEGERMLHHERGGIVSSGRREVVPHSAPTPASGTPVTPKRAAAAPVAPHRPVVVPPPPPPPRPVTRAPAEKARAPQQRANPKKN